MTSLAERSSSLVVTQVGMGQIATGRAGARMKAVLGSCVGLVLYQPRLKAGVMAHIVLPDSAGRGGAPGKFADTAIPEMLRLLENMNVPVHGLIAKLCGGANMFGSSGPVQIGETNARAVLETLKKHTTARVMAEDIGGSKGRRVLFDCDNGAMTVEIAGQPARTL
ncbi:MAG: chemotaxis protein CheD [bacterium]